MSITDELREFASHCAGGMGGDALTAIADRIDEVVVSEYIRLPKDADGVSIHVGDEVVDWETPRPVTAVSEDSICLAGYESGSYYRMGIAKNYRHHHEPTVDDVLFEFARLWSDEELTDIEHLQPAYRKSIAEYAEKLREVVEHERD